MLESLKKAEGIERTCAHYGKSLNDESIKFCKVCRLGICRSHCGVQNCPNRQV